MAMDQYQPASPWNHPSSQSGPCRDGTAALPRWAVGQGEHRPRGRPTRRRTPARRRATAAGRSPPSRGPRPPSPRRARRCTCAPCDGSCPHDVSVEHRVPRARRVASAHRTGQEVGGGARAGVRRGGCPVLGDRDRAPGRRRTTAPCGRAARRRPRRRPRAQPALPARARPGRARLRPVVRRPAHAARVRRPGGSRVEPRGRRGPVGARARRPAALDRLAGAGQHRGRARRPRARGLPADHGHADRRHHVVRRGGDGDDRGARRPPSPSGRPRGGVASSWPRWPARRSGCSRSARTRSTSPPPSRC